MTVPIATSPARSGFGPELSLSYDSGAGNGPFGFGWSLSLPSITRKTDKGLPTYDDSAESDTFLLSGSEDLVPVLDYKQATASRPASWERPTPATRTIKATATVPETKWRVERYRPRIEGVFARIERWTNIQSGEIRWRSISKDNVTSWYGKTDESRIFDPEDPTRVFSWLICESYDDRGNAMLYGYAPEDSRGVDGSRAHEHNRERIPKTRTANRYPKHIHYCNRTPCKDDEDLTKRGDWLFEVVFDYGEHDSDTPLPGDNGSWLCRHDPFSSHRAGFEVRTYRLCQRVLMFHHFPDEPEIGGNYLVRSTDFFYGDPEADPADKVTRGEPIATTLSAIRQSGYRQLPNGTYLRKSLPPVEFEYSEAKLSHEVSELAPESIENLPAGVDGINYRWLDLDGDGLTGVLTEQADGWFYKRNLSPLPRPGDTKESREARFAPLQVVAERPSPSGLADGQRQFLDLAGDGRPDLVQLGRPLAGYHEREDGSWSSFVPFRSSPDIAWTDPNLKFVDLTGDGHADVLISEDHDFLWYASRGEDGFSAAERVAQAIDEESGPRLVFADGTQSIHLADMSGDGLTDLVRICNGSVSYYPNRGRARFGARVSMDAAPWFDSAELFDPGRIRLGDIDGSGVTDIVYLGPDAARVYLNESGNSWREAGRIDGIPTDRGISSVTLIDLLGNGTACLVWSSPLESDASQPMRYVDLMGGQKPHLLVTLKNNLGSETRVRYAPSTKFYLADRLAGRPWITRLPFPVPVVESLETVDRISGNRFATQYAYHDGFFDGEEREFRGFGYVEQWDRERFPRTATDDTLPAPTNIDPASHVPPVYTRTWFHTGKYVDRNHVSNYYAGTLNGHDKGEYYREPALTDAQAADQLLPDTVMPPHLTSDEEREASRALKGGMLREEIYALDGTVKEQHPYTVTEQNFTIAPLQARADNRHAVFFTHAREVINRHYERDPAEPRISHSITLDVNEYGDVLRSLAIGYGRPSSPLPLKRDRDKQTTALITLTEVEVTNAIADPVKFPDGYRTPLPAETRTFELTGFKPEHGADRFSFEEWSRNNFALTTAAESIPYEQAATGTAQQKRLIERVRTLYRRDDLTSLAPFGKLEPLALPGESYKLALTPSLLDHIFKRKRVGQADEDLLPNPAAALEGIGADEGGYVVIDGDWWIPAGRIAYAANPLNAEQELAEAESHFFMPRRYRDPFGNDTLVTYDGPADPNAPRYDLLIVRTDDAVGNSVVAVNDYRVLQPRLVTDPNRNRTAVAFDALGMLVATAVMGKTTENLGDLLEDFEADPTLADLQDFVADPAGAAASFLGRTSSRFVYDLDRYSRCGQPPFTATLARETHYQDVGGAQTKIQCAFSYSDGFGREIQKKVQAEPGDAPKRKALAATASGDVGPGELTLTGDAVVVANTPQRWVGSGRTLFNNKGNPVKEYEPFFSSTHLYEPETELTDTGVSPVLFYDPMERVVVTLYPDHTYEKVVFAPWQQLTFDANDTVAPSGSETGDPRTDPDIAGYVREYFNTESANWQTWHERASRSQSDAEVDAAGKAAAHAGTATTGYFDALGRAFMTLAHNRYRRSGATINETTAVRIDLDVEGNQRAVIDERTKAAGVEQRVAMRFEYDMLDNRIHQASAEAGERWMLSDVASKPIRMWDSRGFERRMTYDELRRPTGLYITENGIERQAVRTVYGEAQGYAANHRTRVYQVFDDAGIATTVSYDFKGNPEESRRDLLPASAQAPDWLLNPAATDGSFTSRTTHDALGRPLTATSPDGSIYRPVFNEANLLDKVSVNLRGAAAATSFISNIEYDAKGQRALVAYGNGVTAKYVYDPLTFRLTNLKTIRPASPDATASQLFDDASVLQDINYAYDPVGNITHIDDSALKTIFYNGQKIEPLCEYTYDAIYRLTEAKGREHIGQTAFDFSPPSRDYPFVGQRVNPNDLQALRNYTERYEYDAAGNFEATRHVASGGSWTRNYSYDEDSLLEGARKSNRLTSAATGNASGQATPFSYDAHGNITAMPHLSTVVWDPEDRLHRVDLPGGGAVYYIYDAQGRRTRKVVESANGTRQSERLYLGGFEIYREFNAAGVSLERESLHVMDGNQRVALVETLTIQNSAAVANPASLQRHILCNHLGSASMELAASGALISYEEYHPYGSSAFQAWRSAAEASLKRYRHTSKERDEESGFYYHGARYCAPWLGRWVSADPAGVSSNTNLYAYVSNNPVIHIDPDGRAEKGWWDETISGVHTANQAIHDASVSVGNKIIDANEADIERFGLKNEYVVGSLRLAAALEATAVSTVLEVGAGILMAGPNILAGLDAGGTEIGEGAGRVVYGQDADERIVGGLQILSGLGKGAEVTLQVITMKRSWGSGTIKGKGGQPPTVNENKAHGDAFRDKAVDARSTPWRDSGNEVTIRPNVGPNKPGTAKDNFRIDTLEKSKLTGKYKLVESKGTKKAPLTKNQVPGFENFEKYGGTVVSKGSAVAPHGTKLPPSKVKVVRPLGLFVDTVGPTTVVQATQERARLDKKAKAAPPPRVADQTTVETDVGPVTIHHPKSVALQ